jgi:hypothetical protein
MKNDTFTKLLLSTISAALVVLALQSFRGQTPTVQAGGRQGWEYKTITRSFGFKDGVYVGVNWWTEDSNSTLLPLPAAGTEGSAMRAKISELGGQGWELVSVTAYSWNYSVDRRMGNGPYVYTMLNGVSTDEEWVFKRPKP